MMPKTGMAIRYMARVTTTTLIRLSQSPVRDIWGMVTRPLPKTTALGPVPDGSIKAQEQANVPGIMSKKGWACPARAIVAAN